MAPANGQVGGAAPYVPVGAGLDGLRQANAGCRGCTLFRRATQTVFGERDATAGVVLVGEQPGDREDRDGVPFVGSAGHLLHEALSEAGIDPASTYVTNGGEHFGR